MLYKAEVEKAKADVAKATADNANWTAQIERDKAEFERLKQRRQGTGIEIGPGQGRRQREGRRGTAGECRRRAGSAAESALAKAEENLKYCTITAPATGRLGQSLVSAGTLVDAYKTELVSVFPINPVYATWEIDELTSLWYREQIRAGAIADPRNPATPISW